MTKNIKNMSLTTNGKIKAISLFSGIGAYEKAYEKLGLDVDIINYCEVDKFAATAFSKIHNVPEEKNWGDITKVNLENIPQVDLVTYSFPCFVAGTLILTKKGYKKIEDIQKGDMVLTHKNRFREVLLPMEKECKKLLRISAKCTDDLLVTEEHPFFIRKKYGNLLTTPIWRNAKKLKEGDYIGIAINKEYEKLVQTHDFWKEIGQAFKEGNIAKTKSEQELIKSIPFITKEEFLSLIESCCTKINYVYSFKSLEKELVFALGYLVAKFLNVSYELHKVENSFEIKFYKDKNYIHDAIYDNGYLWFPITEIKKENINCMVYNMEVEQDNSYTVNNIIVHNCQSISCAGKKDGIKRGETKSGLVYEALDIIEKSNTKVAIMENVKNLVKAEFINDFYNLLKILDDMGYNNYWQILNSKDYGIPQNRNRVIMVSIKKEFDINYKFPKPIKLEKKVIDFLDTSETTKFIVDKNHDISTYNSLLLKGFKKIEGASKNPQQREYSDFKEICDCLLAHDATSKNLVQFKDKNGNYIIRRMLPLESFRLMGFSDEDYFVAKKGLEEKYYKGKEKSDSQMYKMAGNSVVVNVLEEVIKNIYF